METTNESTRKRQKLPNAEQIIRQSPDRLSSLPDSILCHILSFVPTKDSVATSILARRWRFLWADVPVLDFDEGNHAAKLREQMSLPDIINRVMLLHNVRHINTFRLSLMWTHVDEGLNEFQADTRNDTWIRTVIARNVRVLDLDFLYKLPRCIFTCKTLVDLSLHRCEDFPRDSVCLPSLKKLHLDSVIYNADETLPFLLSGCLVLEELEIYGITTYDLIRRIVISSPSIKWLKLSFQFDESNLEPYNGYKLEINIPALKYLFLEGEPLDRISAGPLNSLVEANISLKNDTVKEDDLYSHSVLEFVQKLCQVKCLRLASDYKKFLDSAFAAATTRFHNLTKLELGVDWRFLIKFLESADNLEVLIIREVDDDKQCWVEPEQVPMCLSSHLRTVKIDPFGYSEDELKFVSYILRNAKVLNKMDMCDYDFKAKSNLHQRISQFERRSEACKLAFF